MKVLFINPSPIFGGATTATISVASMLRENGCDVIYNDEYDSLETRSGLDVDHYPYHAQKYSSHKKIREHVMSFSPDWVIWSPIAAIYFYSDILWFQNNGVKQATIVHSLSLSQDIRGRIVEFLEAKIIQKMDLTVFVSDFTIKSWEKYRAVRKSNGRKVVVYNAVGSPLRTRETISNKRIGFVGRFSTEKQPDIFCSMSQILDEGYEFHAWGDGPLLEDCKKRFFKVVFHGQENDIERIYENLDILLITSVFENCPMVILEAMARGIPCVAPRVGGIPEIVEDGVTGKLYDTFDVGNISKSIHSIIDDYSEYSKKCVEKSAQFSYKRIGSLWMELLSNK